MRISDSGEQFAGFKQEIQLPNSLESAKQIPDATISILNTKVAK